MAAGALWLLASALLHAAWNALLKREREPERAALGVLAGSTALAVVAAAAAPGTGLPTPAALCWGAGAGLFEAVYFVTLGAALARATYGAVYAIARGGALALVWPALLGAALVVLGAATVAAR